ncbi:MAG TPA: hypothetical protein VLX92_23930, partial [Kofleriaceae bacterium]|nr:hypothetical protein [Kofleriaceae bacterium]
LERAVAAYRAIVARRASDLEAWRALEELYGELGQWRELAEVRGELAERAASDVDRAVLLRAQARALEQAGDPATAAALVEQASRHAPDDVSGLVDYAQMLAREGRARDAAAMIAERVRTAAAAGEATGEVAALRMRLATILDDQCDDRAQSAHVLEQLLADAPDYAPALERLASYAERDPDPRVHAAALARHAAALDDPHDRAGLLVESARRSLAAGDRRAAAAAFEQAAQLVPEDADLQRELGDTLTALAVERAAAAAAQGDVASAERRLRAILEAHPLHEDANLALADLLAPADAAEHLRQTLEDAPDDAPPERLARLVHRYARAAAAAGDAEQAHQLLHEAHRLARRELAITLALGESCFQRKLWREAAIHLGALAEHPDAPAHAAAVARGLVHAGQAEVRALRPQNATRHYDAAVRLDPLCGPAWHALGELALERGETERAADLLEREAHATADPRERVRLCDALGDLALDLLDDAARAERCWEMVIDDAPAALLDKLLAVQRRRGAGVERGATCERLAELATDPHRIKELLEEACDAFVAGDEPARAYEVADRLVSTHPLDADAIACASSVGLAAGVHDTVAAWLRRALTGWESAGDRGLDDPRRAELWRRLGDAERGRGNDRAAVAAYRRAVEVAPDADGALAARRGLVELADTAGQPTGDELAILVAADPAPRDVVAYARELARRDQVDDARAIYELARALGAGDDGYLAAHPARAMASDEAYATPLDDVTRRDLIDDPGDPPLGPLLDLLGEAAQLVCPDAKSALDRAGLGGAARITSASAAAVAALYPQLVNALAGPQTLLYASPRAPLDITLLLAAPPVVVIGPRLASVRAQSVGDVELVHQDAELRFELGRVIELARPRRLFAAGQPAAAFTQLVTAIALAFGQVRGAAPDRATTIEAERLRQALPVQLRRRIAERLGDAGALDPEAFRLACDRAADRAGLLACGNVAIAIELAGGPAAARHLVKLAAAPRYLAARRALRSRRFDDRPTRN